MESTLVLSDEIIELSESEAACLDAVKEGLGTKTLIAVGALRDFRAVSKALETLRQAQLVHRGRDTRWRATTRGQQCLIKRVPDPALKSLMA